MGLITSHKFLLTVALIATAWYQLNKKAKAATPERVGQDVTAFEASRM